MMRFWGSRPLAIIAVALMVLLAPARGMVRGAELDGSVKLLPADTAFYASMLRNREQIDIVAKSKAFQKLLNLPAVKAAKAMLDAKLAEPDPQVKMALDFLHEEENANLVKMLGDAVSDDMFIYGGNSWVTFLKLLQKVNLVNQTGMLDRIGKEHDDNPQTAQARLYLKALAANTKLIALPDIVLGFKLKDAEKGEEQIKRLEGLLDAFSGFFPGPVKDGYKRVSLGDASVLNLTLDAKDLPWDQIPIKDYEEKEGDYDALIKKLQSLKLSISLGTYKGYVVLAIGESAEQLGVLGGKGKKLTDLPELKPLTQFADRHFTSMSYVSKAVASANSYSPEDVQSMMATFAKALHAAELSKESTEKLQGDLKTLAAKSKDMTGDAGASVSFAFLTPTGNEGYSYQYGSSKVIDASKPLTILDYVGAKPILFGGLRILIEHKDNKADQDMAVEILKHVEEAVLSKLDDEKKKKYEEVKKEVLPLVQRWISITSDQLLPSLDGQMGIAIDAEWTSKQWHKQMPEMPKALPMIEVGLVLGIADAEKFQKAFELYRVWFNEAVKVAHNLSDGQIEEIEWPAPKLDDSANGKLAYYPIPATLGLDAKVVPTAGLSKKVAVLSFSKGHTERLLKATPHTFAAGPLTDMQKPLGAASGLDWGALINAVTPWILQSVEMAHIPPFPPGPDGDVLKQVSVVLEVLRTFEGATSATYLQDGVLVTHSVAIFHDGK